VHFEKASGFSRVLDIDSIKVITKLDAKAKV
jgi:hypothetical protein